jgi:hypothetical protein
VFEIIKGDAGTVTVAAGATAGIISAWNVKRTGLRPDGTPRLRFKAQFSYFNDVLMNMKGMKKRVRVQMRTSLGVETIDIVDWAEARFEDNILTLEDIMYFETSPIKG